MAEANGNNRPTSVFISYSRKDKVFIRKLNDALDAAGINAWVDWEGIPLSSDWMAEITRAIESADAFLFTISPDSLASKVCAQELELGIKLNKKIVPILYRDPVKGSEMHPKLSATNWVYMRTKKDDFNATVPKLIESIQTDLGWIQQHTRLLQRATEWDQKNRNNSYLLQGSDLEDAEKWMTESTTGNGRNVVPLQAEYISTSRKNAIKRQRNLMIGVALALVISIIAGIVALFQWKAAVKNEQLAISNAALAKENESIAIKNANIAATQEAIAKENASLAADRENVAKSQRSAALANIYEERPGEMDISTLFAVDSWSRLPSSQAEDILRHNISYMALPVAQMQQTGRIWNVHPSLDGKYVVTSSEDGSACVWAIKDGTRKYCVEHEQGVQDAFFNTDNSLLFTASTDGTVRFWNGNDGTTAESFDFGSKVLDIDISNDNKWLAVGSADGRVSLLNLKTRKEEVSFDLRSGEIFTVTFDPTSKWLAIGTSEGHVTFWRVNTDLSYAGPEHSSEVYAIAFSPDGEWMTSVGADSTARVAKTLSGGQVRSLLHGDWVEDVVFSPDGSWFVTVSDDNLVHVWDTKSGREKLRMEHGGFVQKVDVSPDGQWIASTGFDQTVRIWDVASGSLMKEISLDGIGAALTFSPDGRKLIVGDRNGHLSIWDISELNARVGYIEFPEYVHKAKFNATGEWVLFNSDDKNIWMIPSDQLTKLHEGSHGTKILTLKNISGQFKISPDSKWIVVSETYGKSALLYNLETKVSWSLPLNADVTGLAFSLDSKKVAITYESGPSVLIWDVETGKQLQEIPFQVVPFTSAYSPKDNTLAIGFTGKIILWDIDNKKEIAMLPQLGEIRSLNFSKDGNWLATSSSDGSIYLWDMINGNLTEPAYKFQQGGTITSLDFSYNDKWLASAGGNGFAYIWDLTTGQEIARMSHSNSVSSVSFSADNSQLITVSRKVVQVWDVAALDHIKTDEIDKIACSRLTENMTESVWEFFFQDESYQRTCPNLPAGK